MDHHRQRRKPVQSGKFGNILAAGKVTCIHAIDKTPACNKPGRYLRLVLIALLLSGCATHRVLVHPKTGERVTCLGSGTGHPILDSVQASDCANQYEAMGFVRAENLTPEQKEMVSKPTAKRIEQEITIKQP